MIFRGIYAIVDQAFADRPLALLECILAGGVRLVQYRAKLGIERELVRAMHARTRAYGALLIVNDDPEVALEADGLHVGQEDLAGCDGAGLRERLGSRLLGISCAVPAQAAVAESLGADYVGVGPFASTATKGDAGAPIGAPGVRNVVLQTALPVVAIGGIGAGNLAEVAGTGAAMAAVVSAIALARDPRVATSALVARWNELIG